jgi:diguanylate cyclase (GGDEF)-like protein
VNAVTDSLTGLFTRGELNPRFDALARRDKGSIFLLDIDHFKLINDCNGHKRGDEVLVAFARFLKRKVKNGHIFRMGGDEFLIIFPGYGKGAARRFAQRLQRTLAEEVFRGEPALRVTLSMGIALFPVDGRTIEDLLICADERLYHAKRNGRNQFCIVDIPEQDCPVLRDPVRLIGRENVFLSMKEQLDGALRGNMKVMVVSGVGGVGKTFLCNKFLEYAEMRGGRIRSVTLKEVSGELSLIRQIIESLFSNRREMRNCLREKGVAYGDELARLLGREGIERPLEGYRLQKGFLTLLEACARRSGSLTLFVDNFEKAAQCAVALLDSVARAESSARVLLLIGFGCDTSSGSEELCLRYKPYGHVKSIVLQPFSKEQHRTLVKTLLGSPKLSNTISEFAYERAEGNPLLTKEVLIAAIEQRIITCAKDKWTICTKKSKVGLSRSIQLFLKQRLRSLRKEESELLQFASVFGKRFESRFLAGLKRMDETTVVGLLRAPLSLGVVGDEGNGCFYFRLMYRDAYYEGIPATERALLHKSIGEQLERCTAGEHKRRSYHHFRCAGEDARAYRVAKALFRSAMVKGSFREA